jgi:peptidoglycan/LPS O-acetylase OafA/YrhL
VTIDAGTIRGEELMLPRSRGGLPITVRGFRPDIQGLRAVAVLLVVAYHASVPFVTGGFVGVDVFFVISGFLITQHLLRESQATGQVSLSKFYARRIRRLLPSALLVILVTVIAARVWGPVLQATSTARDGLFATFYSINYWFAAEGIDYQHAASAVSPLQHFWSLAVEEQYYLIWPVVILVVGLLVRRRTPRVKSVALLATVIAIGAFSLQESMVVTVSNAPLAYFSLQTRGWELAAGAVLAISAPQLARIPPAIAATLSWLGIAAIVGSAFVFNNSTAFPGVLAMVPVLGAALIISAGLIERRGTVEILLKPRAVQFIGTVSYGWYLWHWPMIVLAPYIFRSNFGWVENLEVSFLALWFAVLSYLILERSVLKQTLSRRKWYLRGAIASVLVASVALGVSYLVPPVLTTTGAAATPIVISFTQTELAAQLQSASATRAIPSNLTPTLERALTDVPATSRDGCHVDYTATKNRRCVFGDVKASRTILLFGDSHAEQWFGALNAFAQRDHWKLVSWTKAACPISDVILQSDVLKRAYTECGAWRTRSLIDISKLHPDVIIASQADSLAGKAFSDAVWSSKTASMMESLKPFATTVIFLQDTPHPLEDVPACLAQSLTNSALCNVPTYAETEHGYLANRRNAVSTALSPLGVAIIDPAAWFCTATTCPAIVSNVLVYRDDSHMTQAYSRALEPVLADALSPYVPKGMSK